MKHTRLIFYFIYCIFSYKFFILKISIYILRFPPSLFIINIFVFVSLTIVKIAVFIFLIPAFKSLLISLLSQNSFLFIFFYCSFLFLFSFPWEFVTFSWYFICWEIMNAVLRSLWILFYSSEECFCFCFCKSRQLTWLDSNFSFCFLAAV